ncbi:hypothetical protein PIB30_075888 [Stylosanthes scabra]|uniref:Uncharacterized protein n=1 Tax=Stylosanthes scabra TaxID=79078 RepID=A0ABU6YMN1_9FABA|nr:hypothetical protein [Stylosanthes scabra]
MASRCVSFFPLHRVTGVLNHLRQSPWLNDLHCHHPHPQCRHHVDRLFRHIDEVQHYIRRHRLLPTVVNHRSPRPLNQCHHHREQFIELRRVHQNQLRESLTRIRRTTNPPSPQQQPPSLPQPHLTTITTTSAPPLYRKRRRRSRSHQSPHRRQIGTHEEEEVAATTEEEYLTSYHQCRQTETHEKEAAAEIRLLPYEEEDTVVTKQRVEEPVVPLKEPMSGGLKVDLGFNEYNERLN